jgi:hypothetical protein
MGAFAWDAWGRGGEGGLLAKPKIIIMKTGET